MNRTEKIFAEDTDYLPQTQSRWRRWLQQALREVRLREIASLWGQLGVWLKRVKPHRPLLHH